MPTLPTLPIPQTIAASPAASRPLLETVQARFGGVPNLYRLVGLSPAALEGYLAWSGALQKGELAAATRERIALAIAEYNACSYCLSAHALVARRQAGLDDAEIAANRHGSSTDAVAAAAVKFAVKVARRRGHLDKADVQALIAAGYSPAQVVEIVMQVALNVWTNYINEVARTEIDFPLVAAWGGTQATGQTQGAISTARRVRTQK